MLFYDKDGFHTEQDENNSRIEVSEEKRDLLFQEINLRSNEDNLKQIIGIVVKNGKLFVETIPREIEEQKNIIRRLRANRIFPIINRSNFWFNSLTQQQKDELQIWYQEWLDAPETLTIPNRPNWLE